MRVLDIFSSMSHPDTVPAQIKESEPVDQNINSQSTITNPQDVVTMDVPLLLRIMEYSREDAKTDIDLHRIADNLVKLSSTGRTLDISNYEQIVNSVQESDAPAEKLIKDIEYNPNDAEELIYSIKKIVVQNSKNLPVTRFIIVDQHGHRASDTFDSIESAKFYLNNKFNQQNTNEGYGRYWCSTDKRWKERQGPKQSRS
jgi:hypothetical protein